MTALLLDPPYASDEHEIRYAIGGADVAADVRDWALEHGDDPDLRIALCGYLDADTVPAGWTSETWKAQGGYGSQGQGRGRENASRETIWFSPHCLKPSDRLDFDAQEVVYCARHRGIVDLSDTVEGERGRVCRACAGVMAELVEVAP